MTTAIVLGLAVLAAWDGWRRRIDYDMRVRRDSERAEIDALIQRVAKTEERCGTLEMRASAPREY